MWYLLAELAGVGYLVSGIILGLGWLLVAIVRWMSSSQSDDVATSTKGGSFEWAASNTWTVLGVVEAGFLGGLAGYLAYTVLVPVVWLVGHFSESNRAQAAGMARGQGSSFPRKYLASIVQEIPSIAANAIIIVVYAFIYHRWIVTGSGITRMTTVKDYLLVTGSFFIWSALCVAAVSSMRPRQP